MNIKISKYIRTQEKLPKQLKNITPEWETTLAILIYHKGRNIWLPKSQIEVI